MRNAILGLCISFFLLYDKNKENELHKQQRCCGYDDSVPENPVTEKEKIR